MALSAPPLWLGIVLSRFAFILSNFYPGFIGFPNPVKSSSIHVMNVPGTIPLGGLMGAQNAPQLDDSQRYEQLTIKYMQAAFESCPAKTVIAGTMGFALGGMFGLFMSSMRYDTPLTPAGQAMTSLPVREQLRIGLKDMGRSSYGSAKNFGMVGAIFSGVECCIEGLRARNDLSNGVAAGCITGGVLAAKAGPQAAAIGCAGFAAFSAAIDSYMRMPGEAESGRVD